MVKMNDKSKAFLEKHLPKTLDMDEVNDVLDEIYDFIDEFGFILPSYDYNDLGREAQRVYNDVYLSSEDED